MPLPVVLVVPIVPAGTGNGLAMRAGMLLESLSPVGDVHVVVVPVSGPAADCSWAAARARSVHVVEPVTSATARRHTTRQLGDAELRARLERAAPLPVLATRAPATLVDDVVAVLPGDLARPAAVVAMRTYLAPLGVELASRLGAARLVVDADDDDSSLLRAMGEEEEAAAFDRVAAEWLPDADRVLAASAIDARGLTERSGLESVAVVPNGVRPVPDSPAPPGDDRILFVGNLTYAPNHEAVRLLALEILPPLRARRPGATLHLVGRHDGALDELRDLPGVCVIGEVPHVAPSYAQADAVVVPLRHGAGTRIKVLEAFAHRRPVIATPVAVAGLALRGDEVVLAETPEDFAREVDVVLGDPSGSAAMVERAAHLVESRYAPAAIGEGVRRAVLG